MITDLTWDALFATLLWQATDGQTHLDAIGYERSDIAPAAQNTIKAEFTEFVTQNEALIEAFMRHTDRDMDSVAHDWVLTRNHHGAGFWDRCYCNCTYGRELTDLCQPQGEIDVYVGDDGMVHIMGEEQ